MKTLDEVIKEMECCIKFDADCSECPDLALCTGRPWRLFDTDALTYLKEYKDYLDMMCALPDYYDWVHSADNPPLTWEQLKQMEGKPVWVHLFGSGLGEWNLIHAQLDNQIWFTDGNGYIYDMHEEKQGKTWQVYRKEKYE